MSVPQSASRVRSLSTVIKNGPPGTVTGAENACSAAWSDSPQSLIDSAEPVGRAGPSDHPGVTSVSRPPPVTGPAGLSPMMRDHLDKPLM